MQSVDASISDISTRVKTNADNISTNATLIADVSTRLSSHITDYSTLNTKVTDVSTRVKTNADNIADISTRLSSHITDYSTLNTKVTDISTRVKTNADNISDISTRLSTTASNLSDVSSQLSEAVSANATKIADVSTRLSEHIADYVTIDSDVSTLKTLTASHTSQLNSHDASILGLSTAVETANASISALRNDVSTVDNKIVIYDTSLRSDVSTLGSTLTTHLNEFDTSVRNHFVSLDDSVGYLRTERNRLDASITNLTDYIDTTVSQILSTDRARINAIESLAIDTSVFAHQIEINVNNKLVQIDSSFNAFTTALNTRIDTSLNQLFDGIETRDVVIAQSLTQMNSSIVYAVTTVDNKVTQIDSSFGSLSTALNTRIDTSLNQLFDSIDGRDVVVARALTQHDASILDLIARVTALENA